MFNSFVFVCSSLLSFVYISISVLISFPFFPTESSALLGGQREMTQNNSFSQDPLRAADQPPLEVGQQPRDTYRPIRLLNFCKQKAPEVCKPERKGATKKPFFPL